MKLLINKPKIIVAYTGFGNSIRYMNDGILKCVVSGETINISPDFRRLCEVSDIYSKNEKIIEYIEWVTGEKIDYIRNIIGEEHQINKDDPYNSTQILFNKEGVKYYDNDVVSCMWDKKSIL